MSEKDESIISKLAGLIPGYGGYREQESRRNDDRLTRDYLGVRIADCKKHLDQIASKAASAGNLDLPMVVEQIRDRLDHAQARLAAAVEGYSSWFGARNVDADLLEQVATTDANMVAIVDQIETLCKQQVSAATFEPAAIAESVDLLHSRIDRRTEILKTAGQ